MLQHYYSDTLLQVQDNHIPAIIIYIPYTTINDILDTRTLVYIYINNIKESSIQ